MNICEKLNCFQLQHQSIVNQNIHPVAVVEFEVFVDDGKRNFGSHHKARV